tara:strand:+ start:3029 stop:3412 length:384 start_codon:yes stop_codon:yes gene_type:complete
MEEVFEEEHSNGSDEDTGEEYGQDNPFVPSNESLDINNFYKFYEENKKKFKTSPVLTKYEKTRIISERVQQLSNGGIPFISNPESYSTIHDIALKELSMKKLPFIIKRTIYGNKYELWKLEDLKILN